jgi:VanZ family protein
VQPAVEQPNTPGRVFSFFRYWVPVLLWMALVFSASADKQSYHHSSMLFEPLMRWLFPHMPQDTISEIHHLFRKTCHLCEYAVLAGLVWRAVRKPLKHDPRPWNWAEAGLALSVVFAYAASDELHQVFVPNRTALVSDVLIDTSGGAICLLLLWLKHGGVIFMYSLLRRLMFRPGPAE